MKKSRSILDIRHGGAKVVFSIVFVIFALYALSLLFPLVWMVINSLKDSVEYSVSISLKKPFSLPEKWVFANYADVMTMIKAGDVGYLGMLWNSIWMTMTGVIMGTLFPAITGYCISKYEFRGRGILYGAAIFSMMIPIVGNMGANLKLVRDLGIYNSPLYKIVTGTAGLGGMGFMLMYGFFKNLSWNYAEAVFIDGGGHFTVFFKVMLPQAFSMMFTLGILGFIGGWNDYMTVIIYMPSYHTIASGMYLVANTLTRTGQQPIYFAGLTVSMIPVLVLFACFSDQIMTKVSFGGLKG